MDKTLILTTLFLILTTVVVLAQDPFKNKDAVQLAARLVENQSVSEIPEGLIYAISDALEAVAQDASVAAHAVTYKYDIHPKTSANVSSLRIILDKQATWGQDLTETPIHQIFPNYNLTLEVAETTDAYIVLHASSAKPLNMKFIAKEISILDGVWMVELPSDKTTGTDIQLRKVQEGYILSYSYEVGDCLVDCNEKHYWEFGVKHNGEVTFLGEHGADLAMNSSHVEENFFTLLGELRP